MAGRRSYSGFSTAAQLLIQLSLARQEHDREMQLKAIDLFGKFALESRLEEQKFKHEAMLQGYRVDPNTGELSLSPSLTGALQPDQAGLGKRMIRVGPLTQEFPDPQEESKKEIESAQKTLHSLLESQQLAPKKFGFFAPALGPEDEQTRQGALGVLRQHSGAIGTPSGPRRGLKGRTPNGEDYILEDLENPEPLHLHPELNP